MKPQLTRIRTSEIHTLPELTPKSDERLTALLEAAIAGEVPVYFAAVPLALCVPFDLDYRPDEHPVGAQAITETTEAGKNGQFQTMFAYPRGRWFVIPDDYIPLFAALNGLPDYVPCWVLGKPENDLVRDVQGPINPSELPKLLGLG